jgi:hypothetical protein
MLPTIKLVAAMPEPLVGHFLHPGDPSGRTALCGQPILGVPTNGIEHVVCFRCQCFAEVHDAAVIA